MKKLLPKGFTLVELLVSISIIAVLSVIGITAYSGVQARARDTKRMEDLRQIQAALETYHNKIGSYPNTDWVTSRGGGTWLPGLNSIYLPTMPSDPKNICAANTIPRDDSKCFVYAYYSNSWCGLSGAGDSYILSTRLEAHPDSDLSQQPFYKSDGTLCSNWSESAVNGLYVVRGP